MYYLKDLALIGCGFIAKKIEKKRFGITHVTGTFLYNGKMYPAEVVHFCTGRPSLLYDILGSSPEEAEQNLQCIVNYVESCIEHNTNGIRDVMRKRVLLGITRFITSSAVLLLFFRVFYRFLIFENHLEYLNLLIFVFILCVLCFFVNHKTRQY